jgi:hypothetical protein
LPHGQQHNKEETVKMRDESAKLDKITHNIPGTPAIITATLIRVNENHMLGSLMLQSTYHLL